jgi:hypothetical protein
MPRLPLTLRPITLSARRAVPALARLNSTSTSSVASRVAQQVSERVAAAEKPSAIESAVPVMWALSGGAILAAWSRIDDKGEGYVEKVSAQT